MRTHISGMVRVVCLIITICIIAQGNQKSLHRWKMIGNAHGIEIVDVDESSTDIVLTAKNVSGKTITAFAMTFMTGNNDRINQYEDWFGNESSAFEIDQELKIVHSKEMMDSIANRGIIISAVIYEDGEKEGSREYIDAIEGKRLGKMLETGRIEEIVGDPEAEFDSDQGIAELVHRIGKLPESADEAVGILKHKKNSHLYSFDDANHSTPKYRAGFLSGVRIAREDALRHAEHLKTLPAEFNGTGESTRGEFIQSVRKAYRYKSESMHRKHDRAFGGKEK
jgi:hypothetical protein